MKDYTQPLMPDSIYHIYNHAVSNDNLFQSDENYRFFLKKYHQYISPIADTFAYCLMPNHFHFALRIKSERELIDLLDLTGFKNLSGLKGGLNELNAFIAKQFSNLFNSYSKSYNKYYQREGSLFRRPFRRSLIDSDSYFCEVIHYIHYNPVHHGFTKDLRDWKYSSFESFVSDKSTLLKRDEVIDWFQDKDNFYAYHKNKIDEQVGSELEN